jgi:hypothetical protein
MSWRTELADLLDMLGTTAGRLDNKPVKFQNLSELSFQLRKEGTSSPSACARLLRAVYDKAGPRGNGMKVVSPEVFAKLTAEQINESWDFEDRLFMHEIAKALCDANC